MQIPEQFMQRFSDAHSVCVLTGAGISAESGVPTFRASGETKAIWKGLPFDQISSAKMVKENLDEVWEWFDYRRGVLRECEPNPAHCALADWEDHFSDFTLVTQNVDGLHSRAGSKNVIEVHGNINRSRCTECEKRFQMSEKDTPHKPRNCDVCHARVRPDVVLFGESLPMGAYERAAEKAMNCDMFFVIGTSALVYPAAMLPEVARQHGAFLVEVNLDQTPLTCICDATFSGKAGEVLPKFGNYLSRKS